MNLVYIYIYIYTHEDHSINMRACVRAYMYMYMCAKVPHLVQWLESQISKSFLVSSILLGAQYFGILRASCHNTTKLYNNCACKCACVSVCVCVMKNRP